MKTNNCHVKSEIAAEILSQKREPVCQKNKDPLAKSSFHENYPALQQQSDRVPIALKDVARLEL